MTMLEGRIVELGTHDQLMGKESLYKNLIHTFHSKQEGDVEEAMDESAAKKDELNERERALSEVSSSRSRASSFVSEASEAEADATTDGK